jgi:TM2 domain-containing membrane protein YozV
MNFFLLYFIVNLLLFSKCNCYRTCDSLLMGQYKCSQPVIDDKTQQPVNCSRLNIAQVPCFPATNISCNNRLYDGETIGFYRNVSCKWTTDYKYKTALLLSIFLGVFGIDRFYLGYIGMGLLKLTTFGFMLFGYVFDIVLILTQTLLPADGSFYIVDFYDQIIQTSFSFDNNTYNHTAE